MRVLSPEKKMQYTSKGNKHVELYHTIAKKRDCMEWVFTWRFSQVRG